VKSENEEKEFVSLIEDETRVHKDLKMKLREHVEEIKQEVVTPVEKEHSCSEECNCNKCGFQFNKVNVLIIVLIGLFALGLGTVLGELYLNEETECAPCPQTDCKELDYEYFNRDDIHVNTKNDIDSYFDTSFLSIETDVRNCFIDSNNCYSLDEFKIAYVMVHNFEGNGVVKYKDLNNEVRNIFEDGLTRNNFYMTMMINTSIVNVICSNDICTYDISVAGETGHSFYKYVINNYNKTRNGFTYVIQEYYVVPGVGGEVDKIYDKVDGTLLYEGNEYEFDYKQHADKLSTYEFKFNSNYKFVESYLIK
jgi:hypothetical protein